MVNDVFSTTQNIASNEKVIHEWWTGKYLEGSGRNLISTFSPALSWTDWGKPRHILSQGSRTSSWGLNPGPPQYEAGVLTTRPRRSVVYLWVTAYMHQALKLFQCNWVGDNAGSFHTDMFSNYWIPGLIACTSCIKTLHALIWINM
jgi:hypothetical protein